MNVAILTFEGFNELDSFIALGILNRMKSEGWNVQITCPSDQVTSMNGVTIQAQQPLEFANTADVVLFGSGIYTRDIAKDPAILNRLKLEGLNVLQNKCNVCHARRNPSKVFTLENMDGFADKIDQQVFVKKRMPKGNSIKLSAEDRLTLKAWINTLK